MPNPTPPRPLGPAIYCTDGPWTGQSFTHTDWETRQTDATHRRTRHNLPSTIDGYTLTTTAPTGAPHHITTDKGQWAPLTYAQWTP